jgi:hypothetical protein
MLPEEVVALREGGFLSDEDMDKLAAVQANILEASSEDLNSLLSVMADSLRAEGFDQDDFMKAAQLLEDCEYDEEKLAAVNWTGKMPSVGAVGSGVAELGKKLVGLLGKHKAKIAPTFLAGMTLALGGGALHASYAQKKGLETSLEEIKKMHPELKQDKMSDQHFGALATFSPTIASNPVVAANLLMKMKQWGSIDHKTIQDLISMEKNLHEMQLRNRTTGGITDVIKSTAALQGLVAPSKGPGIFDMAPAPAAEA